MFKVNLNGRERAVDKVPALVLRELEGAMQVIRAMQADPERVLTAEELDRAVDWFCLFLGGGITPEEIYADYPLDRLTYDISLAAMACQARMTAALADFPTRAATRPQTPETDGASER